MCLRENWRPGAFCHVEALALMQLSLEGEVHHLGCLAYSSLVRMGLGGVEGVDISRDATVVRLRPRHNPCIGTLVNEYTGATRIKEV